MLKRVKITSNEFDSLLEGAKVIRRDRRDGVKVALDKDQQKIIKTFDLSRKNTLRRQERYSVGAKFVKNAESLKTKGIRTIVPQVWYWCKERQYELVTYALLPGKDVYATLRAHHEPAVLKRLAQYIARLHQQQVYFRAGHGENYLIQDENQLAIIDIDNLRFGMNLRRRGKNLAYVYEHSLRNYPECFLQYTFHDFLADYFAAARFGALRAKIVTYWLKRYLAKLNIKFS